MDTTLGAGAHVERASAFRSGLADLPRSLNSVCSRKNSGKIKLSYNPLITSSIGSNLVRSSKAVTLTLLQFLVLRLPLALAPPPPLPPSSALAASVNSPRDGLRDHSSLTKTNNASNRQQYQRWQHRQTLTIQTTAPLKPDAQWRPWLV